MTMKTQSEIEAAICEGVYQLERQYWRRKPLDINAYLIGDLLLVRLRGVLTVVEHHLALQRYVVS